MVGVIYMRICMLVYSLAEEPVCISHFDYEYRTVQKLFELEQKIEQLSFKGKKWDGKGGGSETVCLPSEPTWSNYKDGDDGGRGHIYGTETDVSGVFEYNVNAGVILSRNRHQMAIRLWNFEFRAKMAPNLNDSQSTADASTMPTDSHTMAPEPHTKATRRCEFLLRSLLAGHTKNIRWLLDVILRLRCVRTWSRRRHVTSRWYKTPGRTWKMQLPHHEKNNEGQ